jgi:Spy/CpxP family protein refolding chaperone
MTRLLTVCAAALALTAATAWAQPGRGPGGPGGPMGGMFGGQNMGLMLLANAQVQKELELVDDQKAKLKELGDKLQADMREAFQGFRDLSQEERQKKMEELRKKGEERVASLQKEVDKILLPHQQKRLKQIRFQVLGDRALSDAEVIKELGITDEQKSKMEAIAKESGDAMRKLFEGVRDLSQEERQAKMEELRGKMDQARKDTQEKVQAILTDAQKAKLKDMKGAEFKLDMRQMFPGRGGRPGGEKPAPKT